MRAWGEHRGSISTDIVECATGRFGQKKEREEIRQSPFKKTTHGMDVHPKLNATWTGRPVTQQGRKETMP